MFRPGFVAPVGALMACCAAAHAEPAAPIAIISPFDRATMELEWRSTQPRVTGVIRWFDPGVPNISSTVFDLSGVGRGDRWTAPTLYGASDPVLLGFADGPGAPTRFMVEDLANDGRVQIRADGAGLFAVRSEMLQGPATDRGFFSDALILIRFAQLPAPGGAAAGCAALVWATRRRR